MKIVRWLKRLVVVGLLAAVVLVLVGAYTARALMLASLPRVDGRDLLPGLSSPATIARDALSIPVVRGETLLDACRAQGYVAGQDRFFQMDGLRRFAAGRVSALVGAAGLEIDRRQRRLRLERLADRTLESLPEEHRRLLDAYAEGVNAGLNSLRVRPPEYLALLSSPEPWRARDSILVMLAMWEELEFGSRAEKMVGEMREALPGALVDFLTPETSRWDTLISGSGDADPPPMPGPEVIDLRTPAPASRPAPRPAEPPTRSGMEPVSIFLSDADEELRGALGSNNFAVAGARTTDGRAILAGDMHLGLFAPNIWHRVQLEWGAAPGAHRVAGVALPGFPGIVAGSNGDIAWSFTNVTGDFRDLILVEADPTDAARYRTPEGSEPFESVVEELAIRGQPAERLTVRLTRWGPVTDSDHRNRPLVTRWAAMEPGWINLEVLRLMTARTIDEALAAARAWRGPPQNVLLASRDGRIAWTISGLWPKRIGFDGTRPVSWAQGGVGWAGAADEAERPAVIDPPGGVLFTANHRTLPIDRARLLGRNWSPSFRARRISERLAQRATFTEDDLLELQLDTRVEMLDFYRDLLLAAIPADERDPRAARLRDVAASWNGRADADQPGCRALGVFRANLHRMMADALTAPCRAANKEFRYAWLLSEEPMRRLLESQPAHLLPREHADWPAFIRAAAMNALNDMETSAIPGGVGAAWGAANRLQMRHTLSRAVPALGRWLDMPREPMPGHLHAVRVQSREFGASQRLVVSPGREADAILHMPGGQSGHPLSPHYSDMLAAWRDGTRVPLLAGEPGATLTLEQGAKAAR